MKRILSGIKPTGDAHLGGYLGAMKYWSTYQAPGNEVFFFIADLHALNTRLDPKVLRSNTLDLAAWLLVLGINPDQNPIYAQSQVPAHAELCWILNNYTTMGELSRMTQYKDKAQKQGPEGQLVALYDYPVLMAADILLYDADEIPVGHDQIQHVELTRDIAERFNRLYGDTFRIPKVSPLPVGARVMMLDDPTNKMSKSEAGEGCLYLLDEPVLIERKLKRATTDSVGTISHDRVNQPGISNLLEIIASMKGESIEATAQVWKTRSYAELKQTAAEIIIAELQPLQVAFRTLREKEDELLAVLESGRQRVEPLASSKLREVKSKLGLV